MSLAPVIPLTQTATPDETPSLAAVFSPWLTPSQVQDVITLAGARAASLEASCLT